MKKLLLLISIIITFSVIYSQNDKVKNKKHFSKKFEELQKIKLLEDLELNEETTLKFFARRNIHKKNIDSLRKDGEKLYNKMEHLVGSDEKNKSYKKLLNNLEENENKIFNERLNFIKSLNDILTEEQIVKVILFERNFRKDVKDLLIEKGRKRFLKEDFK